MSTVLYLVNIISFLFSNIYENTLYWIRTYSFYSCVITKHYVMCTVFLFFYLILTSLNALTFFVNKDLDCWQWTAAAYESIL